MTIHHRRTSASRQAGTSVSSSTERQVAAQIASLGQSISPGRTHRQRVLEQASESVGRHNGKMRTAQVVVALSFVLVLVSPMIAAISRIDAPKPQTASRANSDALRHAEANRLSFDWALVDLFNQFRDDKRFDR